MHENLESKVRMSEEHLFQIWCLYLSFKESYDQKTASMSFLDIYDVLHYRTFFLVLGTRTKLKFYYNLFN